MIDLNVICYSLSEFKEFLNNSNNYDRNFILSELKPKYKTYLKAVEICESVFNDEVINVFHFQGHGIEGITELIYPKGKAKGIDINKALELEFNFKSILYYINTELTSVKENTHDQNIIDYSDSSLTEKIIALNELGVLGYLKKEYPINQESIHNLAKVVSYLTGMKTESVYPLIYPLDNERNNQSKNPYNSAKTVEKVKNKLNILRVSKIK